MKLSNLIIFSSCPGVRQLSEVSNQMMAVERVLEYRDLEPEKQMKKPIAVSKDWPSKGSIEFRNVYYRYVADAEPVLCDLSLVIKSMEKIGKMIRIKIAMAFFKTKIFNHC